MKLSHKALIGFGFIWVTFSLLAFIGLQFLFADQVLLATATLLVLGILFSLWLIHKLALKRLEEISLKLNESIAKNEFIHKLDETNVDDEISIITKQFNQLLDYIETYHKKLETCVIERTEALQKTNLLLQKEITDRKLIEKELITHKEHLIKLAHYDHLTALPNRVFFNEMLNKTIHHAKRYKKKMAVLFIDLDRFKNINDDFGHSTGDQVLKVIAKRFTDSLRAGDILARLGGDEFIVLLNDIDHAKFASSVAEKLLQCCGKPVHIENQAFSLTASIGIAIYPTDGLSLEDLQRNADIAMYKAKHAGGGIFHYFTQDMTIEAHQHIQLEAALRKAISNHEFVLYYQPKLNLKDGGVIGVEALIRWENSDLGPINPAEFIPLAEETGLLIPIGEWALREACRANKTWQMQDYQPISVAVNLSPKQFQQENLVPLVTKILAETGLDPHYLELEITETAIMDHLETAIEKLNLLKKMGVKISIDDFGTGYTSISYLKEFPISTLKIDQSFIKDIPVNQNNIAITSAIIALAHTLGIQVIAKGVETAEQLQFLADINCDIVQGYYLSRPLPEPKIILQLNKMANLEENSVA